MRVPHFLFKACAVKLILSVCLLYFGSGAIARDLSCPADLGVDATEGDPGDGLDCYDDGIGESIRAADLMKIKFVIPDFTEEVAGQSPPIAELPQQFFFGETMPLSGIVLINIFFSSLSGILGGPR